MKELQWRKVTEIKPYERNPRNNDGAVDAVAASIKEFGWQQPIVVDKDGVIIAGHTRYKAAKKLGCKTVPVVAAEELTEEQVKAYRLADNKTGELAGWDFGSLQAELNELADFDMAQFGFDFDFLDDEGNIESKQREEAPYHESVSVVVECENDAEAERAFLQLQSEGYKCHISTL